MANNVWNKVVTVCRQQGAENAVPLYVNIPCIDGRCSDLSVGATLQECWQFPYEYSP
jgi:hypothetical protein